LSGYKIAFTSPESRRRFGASSPEFGRIFDDAVFGDTAALAVDSFLAPQCEVEIAFIVEPVPDSPGADRGYVITAAPAFEVIDSRGGDWDLSLSELVADNCVFGAAVIGTAKPLPDGIDLRTFQLSVEVNGSQMWSGTGGEMDDPRESFRWLT